MFCAIKSPATVYNGCFLNVFIIPTVIVTAFVPGLVLFIFLRNKPYLFIYLR